MLQVINKKALFLLDKANFLAFIVIFNGKSRNSRNLSIMLIFTDKKIYIFYCIEERLLIVRLIEDLECAYLSFLCAYTGILDWGDLCSRFGLL